MLLFLLSCIIFVAAAMLLAFTLRCCFATLIRRYQIFCYLILHTCCYIAVTLDMAPLCRYALQLFASMFRWRFFAAYAAYKLHTLIIAAGYFSPRQIPFTRY